jgi:type VI secretion system secreted protein VgrG
MQKMGAASIENNTDNNLKSDVDIALTRLINSEYINFSG